MRAQGYWRDKTIDQYFIEAVAREPAKPAIVAYRADRQEARRISYGELADFVARAAGSLRALGVGKGDFVAVQLPNWWEFVVMTLACCRLGAVLNPLMPIFREHELKHMLGLTQARVLVVPKRFRGFDHEAMAESLMAQLPDLRTLIVVDGEGENSFDRLLLQASAPAVGADAAVSLDPAAMSVVMFTSGTTGEPKGAMHSYNTLIACVTGLADRFHLNKDDVLLGCSPVGHMTGFAAMTLQSLHLSATLVFQDIWDAARGVAIMAAEQVTHTAGATPFLSDICDTVAAGARLPSHLRSFLCAGAPIPPVLIERAAKELNLTVCSLWGTTEALASTLTEPERAADKSSTTDGRPLPGVEVCIVDSEGQPLQRGETGRLMVRGALLFLGYYKRQDVAAFDAAGWFDSGDLAYMDAEGYIRINGRTKDVLIRGGENVPVVEIEALLYKHPAVSSVALVGYPDRRMGERGCAFVVLRPGASLDLQEVQAFLADCKVTKQYWPERLEIADDLPRTASGKIQKYLLRERAKAFGDEKS